MKRQQKSKARGGVSTVLQHMRVLSNGWACGVVVGGGGCAVRSYASHTALLANALLAFKRTELCSLLPVDGF